MRVLAPLMLLVACDRACPEHERLHVGNTVVVNDDGMKSITADVVLATLTEPELSGIPGCKVGKGDDGTPVLQCEKRELYLRFSCRDHTGKDHALGLMVDRRSYSVYCR